MKQLLFIVASLCILDAAHAMPTSETKHKMAQREQQKNARKTSSHTEKQSLQEQKATARTKRNRIRSDQRERKFRNDI